MEQIEKAYQEHLKDIEDVMNIKEDLLILKNELTREVINGNGKQGRIHTYENRTLSKEEVGELF